MEVTRGWKSKALISSFTSPASSSSAISFYPVFIRRELFGCRPPGLRSRYKCRKLGHKSQIPRCSLRDSIIERYLVAVTATAVALAAIRFVYSYYVDRKSNAASLEVSKSEIQNDTINSEAIKQDEQNVTSEVYVDIKEAVNAELLNPQFTSAEEEKKHTTSEIIAISQLPQISEEILVSNLKEDIEMGSLSKGFFPKVALEFTAPHSDGFPIKSEHKKGRVTVACIKQGAPSNVKKLETNGKSTPINDQVYPNIINGNSTQINGKSTQFPRTNEIKKGSNSTSENLLIYNRLLRDGRLGDCIELLENMEKEEVLDMDKIHHSTFLNKCKNRRSVKEAIRFVKLIKNPRMSTFNMLLSVCASSQDFDGAHQVMRLLKETGLKPDYKLYTTLISAYGKSGKVDAMFQIFHEMVNVGIMPNVNTYGALIDGCARSGQIAKAFGAYGIMRSKKVQPDRVVFNALITTCGESGAVDRAFDVLSEMLSENIPVLPDHVTVGALIKTCTNAGLVDRAKEVYKMLDEYEIVGSVEVYTIAIRSCSFNGDLQFALQIYNDMKNKGVKPDEMLLSTLFDVAGHAGDLEVAFKILNEAKNKGIKLGVISYSSLMGACCNAKDWEKSLELYEEIKSRKIMPSVSMMNALITVLCEGGQIEKALEILDEMKKFGAKPNQITYTVLIVACEKKDEAELAFNLFQQAKTIGISINSTICGCLTGLCLQRYQKECSLGNVLINFKSGKPQIANKWTSLAIKAYREMISARMQPKIDSLCQVIGCMKFPADSLSRNKMIESLELGFDHSDEAPNVSGLMDGFGIYDPRTFNILEEAVALGMVPRLSLNDNPIVIDATKFQIHIAEIYILEILKALKNRLAAGAQLPSLTILVPNEKIQFVLYEQEDRTINLAGRLGQAVGSLLRRLGVRYEGDESHGQFRITGLSLKRWYEPKLDDISFPGNGFQDMIPIPARLSKGIADQQRNIRSGMNLSFDD